MFKFFKKDAPKSAPNYLLALGQLGHSIKETEPQQYYFPQLHPDVAPAEHIQAMDSMCQEMAGYTGLQPNFYSGFLGYPALAQYSQSSEYRLVAETTAEEMTREWGQVKCEDDKKVKLIEAELKRLNVRHLIQKAIETDHLLGGAQLFIDIEGQDKKTKLPLLITKQGVKKGSLRGFTLIEPTWTAPSNYNSTDPTKEDYFKPNMWFVMGKQIHDDRLINLIMRPVPDLIKPAYNFRGISMTQLVRPFVERFQRTVDSVSDLVHTYSMTGLKTDMNNVLSGGAGGINQMIARQQIFIEGKNNRNVMMVDKNEEEFFQLNTPLTTLDSLQDQALQMLAMPAKIPLIKLLGTPPAGLSANGDGEIRVYYDHIAAMQEAHIMPMMKTILNLVQLSLFGDIDEDVYWVFNPLFQLDDNERADVNLKEAQTAQVYMQEGVLSQEEVREKLSKEEFSGYDIDPNNVPEVDYNDPPESQ